MTRLVELQDAMFHSAKTSLNFRNIYYILQFYLWYFNKLTQAWTSLFKIEQTRTSLPIKELHRVQSQIEDENALELAKDLVSN